MQKPPNIQAGGHREENLYETIVSDAPENSKTFPQKNATDRLKNLFQKHSLAEAVDLLEGIGFYGDDALFILGWIGGGDA